MTANTNEILNKMVIKDGRQLLLRKADPEDAAEIIEYLNIVGGESDNLLFGRDEFQFTVEQEAEYIKSSYDNPNMLMLLGVINNSIVSVAHISSPGRKRITHNSEIAISVKKEYWGRGIGGAVMQQLIRFAKDSGKIRNISLGVKASNVNAIKLYEKCGFVKIGVHTNYFNIDGMYDDEILMDLQIV